MPARGRRKSVGGRQGNPQSEIPNPKSRRGTGGGGAVGNPQSEIGNPKSRRAAPALRWERPSGVWRCLPGTLPAHPCHPGGEPGPCGLGSLRGAVLALGLRPWAGTNSRLAPLRAAGPCGAGGFLAGLPCGASQPVPPCHHTGCPAWRPRWWWRRFRGRDPESLRLRRFRAGKPFPACGVALGHPASNAAKCSGPRGHFQATYDAF